MGEGSAVMSAAFLAYSDLYLENRTEGKRWHRSKERLAQYPFASHMMNKKWWLEEEFNNHMLRFQQVPEWLSCFLYKYFTLIIIGWFIGNWSSFQQARGRGAPWKTQNGTLLSCLDNPRSWTVPVSMYLHGWDHHQASWSERERQGEPWIVNCSSLYSSVWHPVILFNHR